jgi:hypothetical protein
MSRVLGISIAAAIAAPIGLARAETPPHAVEPRDGQHDFDFLNGKWKVQLRKLKNPLHGSHEWVELAGTTVARPMWNGKAQIDEFLMDGPSGPINGLTVRMYSATAHQWSLNWASERSPRFDVPTVGEFKNGRGEFFDQELFEGRSILVRYVWSNITAKAAHFEQAFSTDGGKTWEVNWISDQTRVE